MNWWQTSRELSIATRMARPTDRPALAALLAGSWRRHGMAAADEQLALLSSGVSPVAWQGDRLLAFLGISPRAEVAEAAEHWADVALIALALGVPASRTLRALLETALPALYARGVTGLVCLTDKGWLRSALAEIGFREADQVLTYVFTGRQPPASGLVAELRPATPAWAEAVLALNAAAFPPLWRYAPATTLSWLLTADHAVVAWVDGQPAGFALTTANGQAGYAYLIRVATHPQFQRRGIGRQMVADAILYGQRAGASGLMLNTQASNTVSRHLYEAMGFHISGPLTAVMIYRL